MLSIILYGKNKTDLQKSISFVNSALLGIDVDYRIYQFFDYNDRFIDIINNDEIDKIYILSDDSYELDIAFRIRKKDMNSHIIIITDRKYDDIFQYRLLLYDLIDKNTNYENRLKEDILFSIVDVNKNDVFTFRYNHIIYRIPHKNINYIEKEPLVKRCIVHTLDDEYFVVNSIGRLTKVLGKRFVKTHQSCIINVDNVEHIDLASNLIVFKNGEETTLLADKKKREIKQYICDE